jgi:hypothetical protein
MRQFTRNSTVAMIALVVVVVGAQALSAEAYKVTVTREEANLYRVDGSSPKTYIKTKYCYEYAYSERAIVDTDDMEITFLDSNTTCTIDKILRE